MWHAVFATTSGSVPREHAGQMSVLDVSRPAHAATSLEDSDEPIVLVGHRVDEMAIRVAATFIAANQPGRRIAHDVTDHAPLAAMAALETSYELSSDAGHGLGAWRDILFHTWSGAVLRSVTGLTRPNPTMKQHLRSWLPSSRFVVRQGPDPVAVDAGKLELLTSGLGRGEHDMLVSEQATDDPVTRHLVSTVAPSGVRPAKSVGDWTRVYGRREQFQIALLPTLPRRFVRPAGGVCRGCDLSTSEPVCDFCHTFTELDETIGRPA